MKEVIFLRLDPNQLTVSCKYSVADGSIILLYISMAKAIIWSMLFKGKLLALVAANFFNITSLYFFGIVITLSIMCQ